MVTEDGFLLCKATRLPSALYDRQQHSNDLVTVVYKIAVVCVIHYTHPSR